MNVLFLFVFSASFASSMSSMNGKVVEIAIPKKILPRDFGWLQPRLINILIMVVLFSYRC